MKILTKNILLATAALAVTLTGCSTTSKNMAPAAQAAPIEAPAPAPVVAVEPAPAPAPTYVIEDVNFDFDKSTLKPSAATTLRQVAASLGQQTGVRYGIAGFTDSIGSDAYNQGLSERRAEAVRDYLVNQGIGAAQLTTRGHGESSPLASNANKAGRAQNRRVEVRPIT